MTNDNQLNIMKLLQGDNLELLKQLPDNSVDAVVTDPPYGLGKEPDALAMLRDWLETGHHDVKGRGFMGKEWDAFVPQPRQWREIYRVLKPGGHVLAFAGTRTQDLMALGLRLAGFEIRDLVAWVYGSGFPKSLDVSKAIDQRERGAMVREKLMHFAKVRGVDGNWLEAHGVASASSFKDWTVGGHVPSEKNWLLVKGALDITPDEEAKFEREVVGQDTKARSTSGASALPTMGGETVYQSWDITAPATDAAKQWQGWGTALKPALEPITLARKPLEGTVAENVLKWHTGAVNVDGCRVGTESTRRTSNAGTNGEGWGMGKNANVNGSDSGRWPANLIHDGSEEVVAGFPEAGGGYGKRGGRQNAVVGDYGMLATMETVGYGDTGSAARFFYCAKVSTSERNAGLDNLPDKEWKNDGAAVPQRDDRPFNPSKNNHPTVKPIALMRYLCRLITPPGGVVLDPWMGSGSTGKAAKLEGFDFIGMEMDAGYFEIAKTRIEATKETHDDKR